MKQLGFKEQFIIVKSAKTVKDSLVYSLNDDIPKVVNIIICVKKNVMKLKQKYSKNKVAKVLAIFEFGIF